MNTDIINPTTILVVDDDLIDREACTRQLKKEQNFIVHETSTGHQCLALCERYHYDCILLDYTLPDIDGITLLEKLNQKHGDNISPIVMLTGNGSEEVASRALKRGANDYLPKNPDAYNNLKHFIINSIENSKLNKQIKKMAKLDPLTELLNRSYFKDLLENSFSIAQQSNAKIAVLFIDLDDFKAVNDTQGHLIGDRILCDVADRMRSSTREGDLIARLGGDEFAVLLNNIKDNTEAAIVAEKIINILKEPFRYNDNTHYIGCSIGVAILNLDCVSAIELINQADQAMYCAKEMGKNNYQFYSQSTDKASITHINIASALRESMFKNELVFYYQPIISTNNNQVVAIESLLRWNNEKYAHIGPEQFIPLIEDSHLMIPIGRWIISENLKVFKNIINQLDSKIMLNINLSPKQLLDEHLIEHLKQSLIDHDIDATSIEFEITETAALKYEGNMKKNMANIVSLSFKTGLDDFGSGYASFSHLRDFPLNTLKIDKSFVESIGKSDKNDSLIKAMIYTAQQMNLSFIAEGVETEAQKQYLQEQGCDMMQGYYFSVPLLASDTINFINKLHSK